MDILGLVGDFVAGALATMVGLLVGLYIDRARNRRRLARRDERSIQTLFDRLASKRAFSHASDVGAIDDPEDRQRCAASVLDARAHIGQTCADIERYDDAVPILRQMESDCLAYLNYVEQNPTQYARGLIRLRDRLYVAGVSLQEEVDGLEMVVPGSRAPSTSDWLV